MPSTRTSRHLQPPGDVLLVVNGESRLVGLRASADHGLSARQLNTTRRRTTPVFVDPSRCLHHQYHHRCQTAVTSHQREAAAGWFRGCRRQARRFLFLLLHLLNALNLVGSTVGWAVLAAPAAAATAGDPKMEPTSVTVAAPSFSAPDSSDSTSNSAAATAKTTSGSNPPLTTTTTRIFAGDEHPAHTFVAYLAQLKLRAARQSPAFQQSSSQHSVGDDPSSSAQRAPATTFRWLQTVEPNDDPGEKNLEDVILQLCRREPFDRVEYSRKVKLLRGCIGSTTDNETPINSNSSSQNDSTTASTVSACGFGNLTLFQLFLLERMQWRSESDMKEQNRHLRGADGYDCLLTSAGDPRCDRCFRRTAQLARQIAKDADEFDNVTAHFDCEDRWERRFSPNATCSSCKVWYRQWILVTKGVGTTASTVEDKVADEEEPWKLWAWPPCKEWCEYAQLACPHITIVSRYDYAGLPSFRCIDPDISRNDELTDATGGGEHGDCVHPCDLIPHGQQLLSPRHADDRSFVASLNLDCNNRQRPRPSRMQHPSTMTTTAVSSGGSSHYHRPPSLIVAILLLLLLGVPVLRRQCPRALLLLLFAVVVATRSTLFFAATTLLCSDVATVVVLTVVVLC